MNNNPDSNAVCIFCLRTDKDTTFNREHVIPQNVGGTLFLDDATCRDCNSKLGAHIDAEILKLPDVLKAFDTLGIPHDRNGILNRYYNITGKTGDTALHFGKAKGKGFVFPEQRPSDGSLITFERDYFSSLKRDVKRDARLREAGLSAQEIERRLEELRLRRDQAQHGEDVEYPELGLILRKRSEQIAVNVVPRGTADVHPLVAKIAYEIMFLYGGAEFFSFENLDLRQQLLASIDEKEMQKSIFVMRVEPMIEEFRPVHLIRLEFPEYITILRVAFFGNIEYALTAKPLSRAFITNLKEQLQVENLWAIGFQQELGRSEKSFWTVTSDCKVNCFAVT